MCLRCLFAALSACVAASVATSVDRRAASLSLLAELESIDLEINTIKRGDQTPLTTDDRLLARSAYEVEAETPEGFYLWVETDQKHEDGGNTVFLTGPFAPALTRTETTGLIGHTSHFDDYNLHAGYKVVFGGELLVTAGGFGAQVAVISARSGHYKPTADDVKNSELLNSYGAKFCGFCGLGGIPVDFDLVTGKCQRADCEEAPRERDVMAECNGRLGAIVAPITRAVALQKPAHEVREAVLGATNALLGYEKLCGHLDVWNDARHELVKKAGTLGVSTEHLMTRASARPTIDNDEVLRRQKCVCDTPVRACVTGGSLADFRAKVVDNCHKAAAAADDECSEYFKWRPADNSFVKCTSRVRLSVVRAIKGRCQTDTSATRRCQVTCAAGISRCS